MTAAALVVAGDDDDLPLTVRDHRREPCPGRLGAGGHLGLLHHAFGTDSTGWTAARKALAGNDHPLGRLDVKR